MLGERIFRARKAAGFSLRDLASHVDLSHAAIKKYEDGQVTPSSSMLLKLSRTLNVPVEYFFRPQTVRLDGIEYRKHSSLPKKRLNAIEHEIIDQIERRLELESLFPAPPLKKFSAVAGVPSVISEMVQIEDAAEAVRLAWFRGFAPIPELIDALETHGIRVFSIDAQADPKFDGLAASVNGMPIIVVGSNWPGDRQRFTLVHELAHLMLAGRLSAGLDEELACNRFAAAFLIPRQALLQALGSRRHEIEMRELALLKVEFGISMGGLLHRACDLGIVTVAWHDETMREFRRKGWHLNEPGTPYPVEEPHVFEQLIFHALAEEYIGVSKAAELMQMSQLAFHKMRMLDGGNAAAN